MGQCGVAVGHHCGMNSSAGLIRKLLAVSSLALLAGCGAGVAADPSPSGPAPASPSAAVASSGPAFTCAMQSGPSPDDVDTLSYPIVTIYAPHGAAISMSQMTVAFYDSAGNETGTGTVYAPASVITPGQTMTTVPENYSDYQSGDDSPAGSVTCSVVNWSY